MKLKDVWKKKEVTLSFEAFPPKKDSDFASVASAVEKIAQLKPDFMSVTYGAGGGTSAYTGKIAQIVQAQGVTALAHLTCVSSDRDRIHHELDALRQAGIENILALRGTTPRAMIRRPPGITAMPGTWWRRFGPMVGFPSAGPAIQRGMWSAPVRKRTCAT